MEQKASRSAQLIALEEKKEARLERKLGFDNDCHKVDITECKKHLYLDRERFDLDSEDCGPERKERNRMLEVLMKMLSDNNNNVRQ